jgi:hypothetical protein
MGSIVGSRPTFKAGDFHESNHRWCCGRAGRRKLCVRPVLGIPRRLIRDKRFRLLFLVRHVRPRLRCNRLGRRWRPWRHDGLRSERDDHDARRRRLRRRRVDPYGRRLEIERIHDERPHRRLGRQRLLHHGIQSLDRREFDRREFDGRGVDGRGVDGHDRGQFRRPALMAAA